MADEVDQMIKFIYIEYTYMEYGYIGYIYIVVDDKYNQGERGLADKVDQNPFYRIYLHQG